MKNWIQHRPKKFTYSGRWIDNWFSNMVPVENLVIRNIDWPTTEHFYQYVKISLTDPELAQNLIKARHRTTPQATKHLARKVSKKWFDKMDKHWDSIKLRVMEEALIAKFQLPEWKEKLLATGTEPIIEWNNWNDKFWGVSIHDNIGENNLGLLLMKIRDSLTK